MTPKFTIPGSGIIKGMAVTARNLIGSYHDPRRLPTVQYPEERLPLPQNSRNFPFLVYDGHDAVEGLRCTACRTCEKECPAKVIHIIPATDERGKPRKHPETFDIDISACMSCQICVEVCPFDAIKMDSTYEYAELDRFEPLIHHKPRLAKSNDYYHQIKPTEATEVDARLEEDRQRKEAARLKREAAQKQKEASRDSD